MLEKKKHISLGGGPQILLSSIYPSSKKLRTRLAAKAVMFAIGLKDGTK
jgi:hypothetical protein